MKPKIPNRLENNREIIKILSKIVEAYPDWRFQQILFNLNIVTMGEDRFYEEPDETLKKMKEFLKR